jgi:predicted lipoprotein with Yx(FWY)xxD motif
MKLNILLFLFVFTLHIYSQWSTDPNVNNAICIASGDQFLPQIVSDNSGGAIITWEDFRNGSNYDIYAQRISFSGVVLWPLNGVPVAIITNDHTMPKIVPDGTGGAIITWTDFRSGNYSDIYAQKINANGIPQWTANGVPVCTAVNSQYNPSLISDGNGGAIITWQDKRDGSFNIYAQRINSNGTSLWTTDGVPICSEINKQENPTIASDGLGGAIITWQDYRSNTDYDIYAQRIDSNGNVQWTTNGLSLCSLTGNQVYPVIINNSTYEVIITWFDVRNGIDPDIYAQRLGIDGTVFWISNGVALCTATNLQQFPVLVEDGSSGAIVTWQDYRSGAYDVYAQRIDVDGNVLWTTDGVPISAETDAQMSPDITSDGQGGAIITWRDYRDNGNQDIYAQRIDNNGNVQWTVNGIAISVATTDQYTPAITSDGNGGAIITWWDYRNGTTSDVYAQQVSHNGQLGVVTDVDDKNIPALSFHLEQNYPNPFNSSTTINWQTLVGSWQTIKVFDALGNEIASLVDEYKPAGRHDVEFNPESSIKHSASGIYFYQLKAGEFIQTKKMILLK